MKHIHTFSSFLNEGVVNENAKAKSLRAEYLSAFTELGELDLEVLLNTDYPIKMVGELLGDVAKLEEEYKEWLDKKKISQDLAFKHERDFLEQPQIRNKANKAFKAREIVLNKTMKNIEKELFSIYPILQTMNREMGSKAGGGDSPLFSGDFQAGSIGAILGTGIMKSTGGLWVVETPDEDFFDINITPEQATEYKKYIKNTI